MKVHMLIDNMKVIHFLLIEFIDFGLNPSDTILPRAGSDTLVLDNGYLFSLEGTWIFLDFFHDFLHKGKDIINILHQFLLLG